MAIGKAVLSDTRIRTAGEVVIKAKTQGKSNVNVAGGTKSAKLNRVLHVLNDEHSLISISGLCDGDHTVKFCDKSCNVKKISNVTAIVNQTGGINWVGLRRTQESAMTAVEANEDVERLALVACECKQIGRQRNDSDKSSYRSR